MDRKITENIHSKEKAIVSATGSNKAKCVPNIVDIFIDHFFLHFNFVFVITFKQSTVGFFGTFVWKYVVLMISQLYVLPS